jgi:RimJ/RimL family protein N-acetyltransferase
MLEGRTVVLAPLDPSEISDEYVGWFNDPETFRYLGSKFPQTPTAIRQYVENVKPPNLICKILLKDGPRHVGNISLYNFSAVHRRMELGIVIGAPEARGKGAGHEACSLIIQHALDHLNLHKVTAGTVVENVGMKKVFLDLGFTVEGTLAEHYYLEGRYHDYDVFGLLRDRFTPRHR